MFLRRGELVLSATDLSHFLGCRHHTALDMAVAAGTREPPPKRTDLLLEVLLARGLAHERTYVESLTAAGRKITDLSHIDSLERPDELVEATRSAMTQGADVIVQGALRDDAWFGKPDVMRRIDVPSALGPWSYEVIDTKLARETKSGTILQLGLYSVMVGLVQGSPAERFYVVTPDPIAPVHEFRFDEYAAYLRFVRRQLVETVRRDAGEVVAAHYPDPVANCRTCRWDQDCKARRKDDDHLSLVAGVSRLQQRELEHQHIVTLAGLARTPIPFSFRPKRGSVESLVRVREQARLQFESRGLDVPRFELRSLDEKRIEGLCRLPEPSPGDIFLDLESDTFAAEGGREYLFGMVTLEFAPETGVATSRPAYEGFWGTTDRDERESFERVMDLITAAWKRHPGMHVYHYAPHEPSAFKRLMGRYATRERALDALLRNGKFVDLYGVVRQGMLVGAESYSIKKLERLFAFQRTVPLADANRSLRRMELALELHAPDMATPEVRATVRGYNEDDCVSTLRLRDWLERVREEQVARGVEIPRPTAPAAQEEKLNAHEQRVAALRPVLLEGVPEAATARSPEQQARWLLAYLLDYHRREDKASFWEYYKLKEMPEDDLFDEPQAIAGLELVARIGENLHARTRKPTGKVTDRYRYPAQEIEIEVGAELRLREGGTFGEVVAVDRAAFTVDVLKRKDQKDNDPTAVFAHKHIASQAQEDSLYAIAERVAQDGGIPRAPGARDGAGRALLVAAAPTLPPGMLAGVGGDVVQNLVRAVLALDHSVLPVQGPPGAGKTYAGAAMICALVKEGRRVGISGTSHRVIRNLLDEVAAAGRRSGVTISLAQKANEDDVPASDAIRLLRSNDDARRALDSGDAKVVGGTAWLWSHADLAGAVDVLFVDEAGQMSLANVLAMSPAAKSIVLLGDPQQLEQPRKGSHPEGVPVSALEHMLGGRKTVADDRGVFLPRTWRMCPALTAFTSELFYENRLESEPGLERQRLAGAGDLDGGGLWLVEAAHDWNRTYSAEEVEIVAALVERLTAAGVTWTDRDGASWQVTGADILIVAPYNAQVSRLADRLAGTGARVGTVDKFQGQEAPVAIYSMATSRPEDAPRGMEFLYSLNRLNVATSRARCAAIVVANARLLEVECHTPGQMKLANALCRYREVAKSLGVSHLMAGPERPPNAT